MDYLCVFVCVEMGWRGLMGNMVFNWFSTQNIASEQTAEQQEAGGSVLTFRLWLLVETVWALNSKYDYRPIFMEKK